ncbi:hypothetical protein DAEQUDRAFT_720989 [Daedalea quercina L-15889]|uniref:Uncharacterized protein n=1 Tax=Daedalea quercina L-15889 TaxID=1314783 RepID=A0A165TXW2_9APHY|nr:hypothetical protein DAEQUDRAFT_720989 [Daedalea quercina L-15889]
MASRALAPVRRYDIPPYALSGRMWHYYPSPSELRSVGLENISYDVLTYNPDERTQKARELRRSLLDVFFRDMHKQDKATWESCAAVFQGRHGKRGDQEEYDEWIGEAIECVLREREMVSPSRFADHILRTNTRVIVQCRATLSMENPPTQTTLHTSSLSIS